MRKKKSRIGNILMGVVVALVPAGSLFADGYRNPPPTAEGIAKSGANMVFVDDASAVSYNPANLGFQTNASIVISPTLARAENRYNNSITGTTASSDNSWQVLPNLFASLPIGESGLVAGLGITTPYGQSIEWNKADVYNPFAPISLYQAEISLLNVNPNIAFKVGDNVSVGFGADIYYSTLELNGLLLTAIPGPPVNPLAPPPAEAKAEGDDWGVGGNIALTWNLTDRQRAAFTYRSRVDLKYEGDFSVGGVNIGDFSTEVKYPNTVGAGYGLQLTDTIQIEALLEWLEWSVNDVQTVEAGPLGTIPQVNNWDDTFTVAIGGSWRFADNWTVRTGYTFIESPIPDETITPILPDTDRHVIGLGLGYSIKGHSIDLSYAFSIYEDRTSTNPAYPGSYDIDSDLVGVTYSYAF